MLHWYIQIFNIQKLSYCNILKYTLALNNIEKRMMFDALISVAVVITQSATKLSNSHFTITASQFFLFYHYSIPIFVFWISFPFVMCHSNRDLRRSMETNLAINWYKNWWRYQRIVDLLWSGSRYQPICKNVTLN